MADINIGTLKVYLTAVTSPLQKKLSAAQKTLSGFGKAAAKVIGGLTVFLGVNSLAKFVDGLDALGKKSDRMGITTARFQQLEFAAERTGTSMDLVVSTFGRLRGIAGMAISGGKEQAAAFARVGLSIDDLRRMKPDELFDTVTQRIMAIQNPTEQAAAATRLLGENFQALGNFLKDYQQLGKELEESGNIIDESAIRDAEKFNDMLTNLKRALTALCTRPWIIRVIAEGLDHVDYIVNGKKRDDAKNAANGMWDRQQVLDYVRNQRMGRLTHAEREALLGFGDRWADMTTGESALSAGVPAQKLRLIDRAMSRLGFGSMATVSKDNEMYIAGGQWASPAGTARGRQIAGEVAAAQQRKQAAEQSAAAKKALAAQMRTAAEQSAAAKKAADLQKSINQLVLDNQLSKLSAPERKIYEYEQKYGTLTDAQKAQIRALYPESKAAAGVTPAQKSENAVFGSFSGDVLSRQLMSVSWGDRTARATEATAERVNTMLEVLRKQGGTSGNILYGG